MNGGPGMPIQVLIVNDSALVRQLPLAKLPQEILACVSSLSAKSEAAR